MRVAVLASGRGSNVQALLEAISAGRCQAEIVGLIADRSSAGALDRMRSLGLPAVAIPMRRGESRARWDQRLLEASEALRPDLLVLAGFMRILGPAFIERFRGRIINVHPSLLPAFPGAHAPADAIAAGVRISGCTVHGVDEGVDTGPILAQAALAVLPGDDAASLHSRIQRLEHTLLPAVIDWIGSGALELGPPIRHHLTRFDDRAHLLCPHPESGSEP
ncbi:MAG: phosphoribosylglycinamide formyltransferase [Myxococcales bacterium]|nr:phosphoribosylglycinamide formyltransferase [Myxococcales bacterium]